MPGNIFSLEGQSDPFAGLRKQISIDFDKALKALQLGTQMQQSQQLGPKPPEPQKPQTGGTGVKANFGPDGVTGSANLDINQLLQFLAGFGQNQGQGQGQGQSQGQITPTQLRNTQLNPNVPVNSSVINNLNENLRRNTFGLGQ